ncbi:ankyrin repeat domain-containing protein 50-like [Cotesia glomerata]|nr:ankyrin repeat domain-containing protein 50-like [Cotesia glomerata]
MGKDRYLSLSDVNVVTVSELVNRRFFDFYALRKYDIGLHKPLSCTLLYAAVMNADEECVDLILPKLNSVFADKGGFFVKHHESAVHRALNYQDFSILRKLIEHGASVNDTDSVEHEGQPLLHFAVEKGYYEIAQYLVEKGADVNMPGHGSHCETTPLMEAVIGGSEDMVNLLVENGADVNADDNEQDTPVTVAATSGKFEIMKLLLDHGARVDLVIPESKWNGKKSIINEVVCTGNVQVLKHLLDRFDVDLTAPTGDLACSTLAFAVMVRANNGPVIQELLDAGSDVNSLSYDNKLPIEMTRTFDLSDNKILVKKHVVKLVAAGQEVCEKNLEVVQDPEFADLRQECDAELEELKSTKLEGSNVTLFDVLFGKVVKKTMKKVDVKKSMETLEEYPMYGRMLFYRLKKFRG